MCNTRSNVFLQPMKTNPLSVKRLMKKLILRALRQLYAVSEIIILIRWVTPPTKVENLQFEFFFVFEIPNFFKFFNFALCSLFPVLFFIRIYISMSFKSSTAFTYCYFFKLISPAKWMWSDPSPSMLNSTQLVHKLFMCVLFETCSKSSLCPCQLKNLRTKH